MHAELKELQVSNQDLEVLALIVSFHHSEIVPFDWISVNIQKSPMKPSPYTYTTQRLSS